jgi:hypothetical protein
MHGKTDGGKIMAKVEQITTGQLAVWAKHYSVKELSRWESICKTMDRPEPNPLIYFSELMMGKRNATSSAPQRCWRLRIFSMP